MSPFQFSQSSPVPDQVCNIQVACDSSVQSTGNQFSLSFAESVVFDFYLLSFVIACFHRFPFSPFIWTLPADKYSVAKVKCEFLTFRHFAKGMAWQFF